MKRRASRLMDAWKSAPDLAEANWHMARVRVDGQWETVAQVANHTANDPDWAKYRELREKAAGKPQGHSRPGAMVPKSQLVRRGSRPLRAAARESSGNRCDAGRGSQRA